LTCRNSIKNYLNQITLYLILVECFVILRFVCFLLPNNTVEVIRGKVAFICGEVGWNGMKLYRLLLDLFLTYYFHSKDAVIVPFIGFESSLSFPHHMQMHGFDKHDLHDLSEKCRKKNWNNKIYTFNQELLNFSTPFTI
jgi:hypothetical protein